MTGRHAWHQGSASDAIQTLKNAGARLEQLFSDEDGSFSKLMADFDMDGTAEAMVVNHDLLIQAKTEARACVQMAMDTVTRQSDIAGNAMRQTLNIVQSIGGR
ncbi:MAG TPA: hypothetical protein GX743_05135 [Actinomycetales bacterium]|nr:hypothetical protein [Actinomycetales bacterium]